MADLRVTDLQKIIRGYADAGHDITQNQHQVHVDDKPYGMVIGHSMHIDRNNYGPFSALHSFIMQAERPVVTKIGMISFSSTHPGQGETHHPKQGETHRSIWPLHRTIDAQAEHRYKYLDFSSNGDIDATGVLNDIYNPGKKLWTPNPNRGKMSPHEDVHEALQAHTSQDIPNVGQVLSFSEDTREMTPREHASFKDTKAFRDLVDVKPFAGLVAVSYNNYDKGDNRGTHYYTYDPQTEELKGPRFWGDKNDD